RSSMRTWGWRAVLPLLVGHRCLLDRGDRLKRLARSRTRTFSIVALPQFHDLSPLQEPSSFEDRRRRLLNPRGPRSGLFRAGEVKQVSPLPARRQRLERALELRILAEFLLQLRRQDKLPGLGLDLHSGLLGRHGL